jgi:hypothetical protein
MVSLWLGISCPQCNESRALSDDDKAKLQAKHPVACRQGHRFTRQDGFLHWLLETSPFGSALVSCDTVYQGEIDSARLLDRPLVALSLPRSLEAAEIWWRTPIGWPDACAKALYLHVSDSLVRAVLPLPTPKEREGIAGQIEFQVVGAANPDALPGWRQVLAEAVAAYEEGRHNVAALLGNVAFETFYSSIADPILASKGMPESIVQMIHSRITLEDRLTQGFARPLGLPHLNDAHFWGEWKGKARRCRNSLAHRWVFDAKKAQATRDDARPLLFLQLKALCHLNAACFDWLLALKPKRIAPRLGAD